MKRKNNDCAYIWIEDGKIYKAYIRWKFKDLHIYNDADILIFKSTGIPNHKLREIEKHLKECMEREPDISPLRFLQDD